MFVLLVAITIAFEFSSPPFGARFGNGRTTAIMQMPKTSMHHNDSPVFRESHVGPTRQICPVETKAKSFFVEEPSNYHFRFRVTAANCCHVAAPGFLRNAFSHRIVLPRDALQ
jgi:hypothetical protein